MNQRRVNKILVRAVAYMSVGIKIDLNVVVLGSVARIMRINRLVQLDCYSSSTDIALLCRLDQFKSGRMLHLLVVK